MTNWGAAPRTPRRVAYRFSALLVLASVLAVLTAAPAQAAPDTSTAPTALPGSVWGFEVNRVSYRMLGPRFAHRLRTHGVNALVVRPGSLGPAQVERVRNVARAARLLVFAPLAEERPTSAVTRTAADTACRALELASPGSRCAVYARTLGSARQLTASGAADVVIVPSTMRSLRSLYVSGGRVVVMLSIPAKKHFKKLSWRRAAVRSKANRNVDLAAGPTTQRGAVDSYLSALKPIAPSGDRIAPTTPKNLATTDATASRTAFTWSPSTDNKKVAGYGVYLDGMRQKDVKSTTAYLPRLTCGAAHLLEVDAYDVAGNRSAKAAMAASSGDCVPLPPPAGGLVAAYGFEETSGATTTDGSGNGNTGTVDGASRTTAGRFGGGLRFDGVDDQVSVLDDDTLDLTNAMTLEAWVRPTSALAGWRTVALKEQTGDLVYGLYAASSGYAPSGHVYVGGDDKRVLAPGALAADAWSHLATTYDGTTLRLYVNGMQAAELALSGPLTPSNGLLRVGGNLVWNEWFAGTIDEVRVYDRALSASEVQSDMADPVGTPAPADTEAPTTPGNFRSPSATGSSVSLAWNTATDNTGVTEYAVYRDGNLVGTGLGTTRTVTGLACGTTYSFAVDAADAAGNRSAQATLSAATASCPTGPDTEAPTTPTGLAKTGSTQTSISVSWSASTDNVGVSGYGAYRDGAPIGTPTGTTYTFTGLACGTAYALAVDAADAAGNRSTQTTLNASTNACPLPPDSQAPTTPGNFRSTGVTATSVSLAWNAATDNTGVTGYGVYRGGNLVSSPTGLTATVSGLSCGTSYTFAVDAVDAAANRSLQATVSASTSTCPPPGTADLYVATNGSSLSNCTQASPCSSFDRAYAVAQPGNVVQVADGSYSGQTIKGTPKPAGAAPIIFQPAPGAAVTVSSLRVNEGGGIEFRDFTVTNSTYNGCNCAQTGQSGYVVREITYRRIKMKQFFVRGADRISYIEGEVGPNGSEDGMNWIGEGSQSSDPASDILLDGIRIHDFTKHTAGAHVDCIGVDNVDGLIIRNSRIWNCAHFSIIFGNDITSGSAVRNALVENNFFDCCHPSGGGYYSLGFGGADGPVMIRFNSMTLGMGWLNGTEYVPNGLITLDSNVIATNNSANCSRGIWRYNVIPSGSNCGNGGIQAATSFLNPPTDLHLFSGAAAVNAGNPSSYPATDIDGDSRPAGGRADAGADERG